MEWSPPLAVALALLMVVGATAPAAAAPVVGGGDAQPSSGAPPDPDEDVLGWEGGYWANESIEVNVTDGINETELNATVARSMARVEAIRGLEFRETVPVTVQSRQAFRAEQANRSTDPDLAVFDNAKFEALLLIGEEQDSIEVQRRNTGSNVLAYYSASSQSIVVISTSPSERQIKETTLAHELVHALQDQHFNLSRYDAQSRDQANAQNGLIEGDASLVDHVYERRCGEDGVWNGTCVRPSASIEGGSAPDNWGVYFLKFQPYSDGPAFLSTLIERDGWEAVNAAYDRPPNSSEQVIHPEKYLVDEPSDVPLEDRNDSTWTRVRPPGRPDYATVGEASLTSMLVFPLYDSGGRTQIIAPAEWLNRTIDGEISSFDPLIYENPYATGWDGDRLHVYRNADNKTAYVWRLVWDSPADAREFVSGYLQALEYWGAERVAPGTWVVEDGAFADAFHITVVGDTVTVVNAPTVETLPSVRQGVEVTPSPTPAPSPAVDVVTLTIDTPSVSGPGSPGSGTVGSPDTTSPGQPGFGVVVSLLALLAVALLARRRAV